MNLLELACSANHYTVHKNHKNEVIERSLFTIQTALEHAGLLRKHYFIYVQNDKEYTLPSKEDGLRYAHKLAKRGLHGYITGAVQEKKRYTGWTTIYSKIVWTF